MSETWAAQADCRDMPQSLWYPDIPWDPDLVDDGTIGPTEHLYEEGKAICAKCPVQRECLDFALDNKERYGMWGGQPPIGRLRIERKHRRKRMLDRRAQEDLLT